jgi:hypothetical protein
MIYILFGVVYVIFPIALVKKYFVMRYMKVSHNYHSNKMHTFIIKNTRYYNLYFFVLYFAPTCFNPRGSSSGGSMPVPG